MKLYLRKNGNRTTAFVRDDSDLYMIDRKNRIVRTEKEAGDIIEELEGTKDHISNIVKMGYTYRPDIWRLPQTAMTRLVKMSEVLTQSARNVFRRNRSRFVIEEKDTPWTLDDDQFRFLCKDAIISSYIHKKLRSKKNKILVASREVRPCVAPKCWYTSNHKCVQPNARNVYHRLKPSESYEEFVAGIPKKDRIQYLCGLLEEKRHIGGFCIYRETDDDIIVWVLCSNRALGKRLLDHLIHKKKKIIIDSPLDEAVEFYQRLGWKWQNQNQMVRQ